MDCLEDLLSYPDKNEIDILLMDVDYALPDIEGNLRLIQDQFPNKPVVALVDIKNFEDRSKGSIPRGARVSRLNLNLLAVSWNA